MKIFIHSCHAVLEYDQAKMFQEMGHEVRGIFDIGSTQRPKVDGVTDESVSNMHYIDIAEKFDVVVLHQFEDVADKARRYAEGGCNVIVSLFGQGNAQTFLDLTQVLTDFENVHLVPYSQDVVNKLLVAAKELKAEFQFSDRVSLIRFGKNMEDFNEWTGESAQPLVTCNDIHHRGDGCAWKEVLALHNSGIPFRMTGINTDDLYWGMGALKYRDLLHQFAIAPVVFVPGTIPATYTLSFIEALCTGTPVVIWNNGCGIEDEFIESGLVVVNTLDEAEAAIKEVMEDRAYAEHQSRVSLLAALRYFDNKKVVPQWANLLEIIKGR